ncbi:hypothetical protein [Staphylococcus saprophyticus]|uniref:hypothetical protein n=1 Tax=Staphylococcus saprophyticus TaxID=29385 RepID=UPI0011A0656A|nr:hypothetical protein [Staphylococcus saprophyticus]MDW4035428.1 hypothetical protein [Staphylococcus saprophyticus]
MENVRKEVVNKGKLLVDIANYGGEAAAFRQSIDLIVEKMDNITDKDSKECSVLNELLNELWNKHNVVEKLESEANERMKELMNEKKALSQAGKQNDNA